MQNHIAALGALIIQKRMRLSDRALVKAIAENPYYQYFIGLQKFTPKCPFTAPALVSFRKRLTADALVKFNEICLRGLPSTPEHRKERTEASENGENAGTMILDATASPSNIRFPQDFSLLNEARKKTDCMIDLLHKQIREKLHPRTYREVLHNGYLNVAKSKKRTAKAVRSLIRKLLCAVRNGIWPGRGIIPSGSWRIKSTTRRKTGSIAERTGSVCRGGDQDVRRN